MIYTVRKGLGYSNKLTVFPEWISFASRSKIEYEIWTPTLFPHFIETEENGKKLYRVDLPFTASCYYVAFSRDKNWDYQVYRVETQPMLRFASPSEKEIEELWEVIKPSAVLNMYKTLRTLRKTAPHVLTMPVYSLSPVGEEITSEMNMAVVGYNKNPDVYDYFDLRKKFWFVVYPKPRSEKLRLEKVALKDMPDVKGLIPMGDLFDNELAKQSILALKLNLGSYDWVKGWLLFVHKYRLSHPVKYLVDGVGRGTFWLLV